MNETTGDVYVANELDRNVAATVTIKIQATDNSASPLQHGFGNLVTHFIVKKPDKLVLTSVTRW